MLTRISFYTKLKISCLTCFFFSIQGAKTGKDNGYTMLFDIESFDYSYYDEGSEGLKLALVHHLDMPIMRQKGFHIAPGIIDIKFFFLDTQYVVKSNKTQTAVIPFLNSGIYFYNTTIELILKG